MKCKKSRTCESCHSSLKGQGKGINGGNYFSDQSKTTMVDLMYAQKKLLVKQVDEQIPAIPNLKHDYSVMIDANGTQVQTVGNHWKLSQALDKSTLDKLDRSGACLSCHKEIPHKSLAVSALVHIKEMSGLKIDNDFHKDIVHKSVLISAWVQIVIGVVGVLLGLFLMRMWMRKKKE